MASNAVSPDKWIDSYYYCGDISKYLFPFWKEKFIEIISNKIPINEVVLTGSIGGGKTYFANTLLLRKLYELAVLNSDMWDVLGLARGSAVFFVYFSISIQQAKFTGYQELITMIDSIPFFRERFPRDRNVEAYLKFPRNVFVITGSKFQHQIGLNVLGSVLDEANFRLERDAFRSAFDLYTTIIERRLSRFVKNGRDLGLSILISSAMDENSFVETRVKQIRDKENVKVIQVAGIDVKKDRIGESSDDFIVFVGESYLKPRVIESWDDFEEIIPLIGIEVKDDWKNVSLVQLIKDNESLKRYFRIVPGVFRDVFDIDIVRAVRDVLGVPVGSENKLMKSIYAYDEAVDGENVFDRDVIELSMYDERRLQDYFSLGKVREKGLPRYIHCDLALTGCRAGMACSYVEGVKKDELDRVLPIVRVEWMIGIEKSEKYRIDDEIPFWKIREFLIWLRDREINVVGVTFDSFQSADMIQLLKRSGMNVEKLSVDINDEQYVNLVQLYLERRIKHCHHELYRRELFGLEWMREKKKVDHAETGSKDISDAVCGSTWMSIKNFNVGVYRMAEFATYQEKPKPEEDILDMILKEAKRNRIGEWWNRVGM